MEHQLSVEYDKDFSTEKRKMNMDSFIKKAIFWFLFRTGPATHSTIKGTKHLK
jgi:hypothetical protein